MLEKRPEASSRCLAEVNRSGGNSKGPLHPHKTYSICLKKSANKVSLFFVNL